MTPLVFWPMLLPVIKRAGPWIALLLMIGWGYAGCWVRGKQLEKCRTEKAACSERTKDLEFAVADRDRALAELSAAAEACERSVEDARRIGEQWELRYHELRRPTPTPPPVPADDAVTASEPVEAIGEAAEWLREVLP